MWYEMELERLQGPDPLPSVRPSCSHTASVSFSKHQAPARSPWGAPSSYLLLGYFIALSIICIIMYVSLHERLMQHREGSWHRADAQ